MSSSPKSTEALFREGDQLLRRGQSGRAVALYENALSQDPHEDAIRDRLADLLVRVGDAFRREERTSEALRCYQRVMQIRPDAVVGWLRSGSSLMSARRHEEAVAVLKEAVRRFPQSLPARLTLGSCLAIARQYSMAEAELRTVIELFPDSADAYATLGGVLLSTGELEESVAVCRAAQEIQPDHGGALANEAAALTRLARYDEAARVYQKLLVQSPGDSEILCRLGTIYFRDGDRQQALRCLDEAIGNDSDHAESYFLRGLIRLSLGDYENGWSDYEWRYRVDGYHLPDVDLPRWEGGSLKGKTIVVVAEQGLGDAIHLVRYASCLKKQGAIVHFQCHPNLVPLISTCPDVEVVVEFGKALPRCDLYVPLMSLPYVLGTIVETIPSQVPYVVPPPDLVTRWGQELGPDESFKIAVAWRGNVDAEAERSRAFSPRDLISISQLPGVRLYCVQKGDREECRAAMSAGLQMVDFGEHLDTASGSFMDTAAIMSHMDLVISCDSAVTHLAGALGVPAWVALSMPEAWQWLTERDDSPWYPNHRLFRQQEYGDWGPVFDSMKRTLAARLDSAEQVESGSVAASEPDEAAKLFEMGVRLWEGKDYDDAIDVWRQCVDRDPDVGKHQRYLGVALAESSQLDEAASCLRRACELEPDSVDSHYNLANVLRRLDRLDEAVTCYERVVALDPRHAKAQLNLGAANRELGRLEKSVEHYEVALDVDPTYDLARIGLSGALQLLGSEHVALAAFQPAIDCFQRAAGLEPNSPGVALLLGQALFDVERYQEGIQHFERALQIAPDHELAHLARSYALLAMGDYQRGWRDYEWRWSPGASNPPKIPRPRWDGSPLQGRRILLHCEQGFGDTIQFIRYAPLVKQRGGHVLIDCPPPLARILSTVDGVDEIVPRGEEVRSCDIWIPLMSLPRMLQTTLETVPNSVPYLHADEQLSAQWHQRLTSDDSFKIGIAWKGNVETEKVRTRAFALAELEPVAKLPGVQLYSFQKGDGSEQVDQIAGKFQVTEFGEDFDESAGSFMDTAAVMKCLDLVITCDTSLAHLAGSLGVKTWVALTRPCAWQWLLDRDDSPWYPTMRLFRQSQYGDWPGVFEKMRDELLKLLAIR